MRKRIRGEKEGCIGKKAPNQSQSNFYDFFRERQLNLLVVLHEFEQKLATRKELNF